MTYLSFCKLGIQDNQEELPNGKDPKWVIENSITPGLLNGRIYPYLGGRTEAAGHPRFFLALRFSGARVLG